MQPKSWKLNTSNSGKYEEFKRLFLKYGVTLEVTHIDLSEIDAEPEKVIIHKASQMDERVLVEDTSLEIEGTSVGIHIRWLLDHLAEYAGRKATWIVFLAYREGEFVKIYRGIVHGTIVQPKGAGGFGFDPFFQPDGALETLAQSKPDQYNARAKAVEAAMKDDSWKTGPTIASWEGPWQDQF